MAQRNLGLVVFWMIGALLSFSASAVAIRGLMSTLTVMEILSIRTGFGLMVMTGIALMTPSLRVQLRPGRLGLHLWRNGIHFVGQYLWAWSVTVLPLATVFALEFTMPMWVALLAVPLLGEKLTVSRVGSVILGFLGVLMIVRPFSVPFLSAIWATVEGVLPSVLTSAKQGSTGFQPEVMLVLCAAFAFAFALIATKQLTRTVSAFTIIFWMNLIQFPICFAGSDPLFLGRLGWDTALPALTMGVAGLTSHFCLTKAFAHGDASVVVPLDFLRIPLIALVGWLLYNEAVDLLVFAGAGLIIAGVLWNLHDEARRPPTGLGPEKATVADA